MIRSMNGTRPLLTLVAVSSWFFAWPQGSAQNAAPDPASIVEKRVALIVGIDEYTHLGQSPF
jgi:hypothetical protein